MYFVIFIALMFIINVYFMSLSCIMNASLLTVVSRFMFGSIFKMLFLSFVLIFVSLHFKRLSQPMDGSCRQILFLTIMLLSLIVNLYNSLYTH